MVERRAKIGNRAQSVFWGKKQGQTCFYPQFSSVLLKFITKIGGNTFIYILGIKQAY